MPIRPEERARYPKDWPAISREVRERAGQKCERCNVPNGEVIWRGSDGTYMLPRGEVFDAATGEALGYARGSEYPVVSIVKIVLTVAHMDHTPENCGEPGNRPNLKALCQKCHLTYDAAHHARNAARTRRARKASGDLFAHS